jgi:hypothetical protein
VVRYVAVGIPLQDDRIQRGDSLEHAAWIRSAFAEVARDHHAIDAWLA